MSSLTDVEVSVECCENHVENRIDAGVRIGGILFILLFVGWFLIPAYVLGYLGEKLGVITYSEERGDSD